MEGKSDEIADRIGEQILRRGISQHGEQLKQLNEQGKAKAECYVSPYAPFAEDVAKQYAERGKDEAVEQGIHKKHPLGCLVPAVVKGDQIPQDTFLERKGLQVVVVPDQELVIAQLQHQHPDI